MKLRSLLFVPGDRPDRFAKASASGADAIIIDLEDSVALGRKVTAREAAAEYLSGDRPVPVFVRVNPEGSHLTHDDLASVLPYVPDGIVLPKAEGARSVNWLRAQAAAVADNPDGEAPPILPIATETPGAVFDLGTLREVSHWLVGVSWGAEDLADSIGASSNRNADGSYGFTYELARTMTLLGAATAGVAAIETIQSDFRDLESLKARAEKVRRDGFHGMLAIHPAQVEVINAAFTPGAEEIAEAQEIVAVFAANPGAGTIGWKGGMLDRPHLSRAQALLAQVEGA